MQVVRHRTTKASRNLARDRPWCPKITLVRPHGFAVCWQLSVPHASYDLDELRHRSRTEEERSSKMRARASRDIALRLLVTEGAPHGSSSDAVAEAGARVLERLQHTLARWFGADGARTLLSRALDKARSASPGLEAVKVPSLARDNGLAISPDTFAALRSLSADEATEACASAIAEVVDLLGRLVGDDVAWRLVEHGWPGQESEANPTSPERTRE